METWKDLLEQNSHLFTRKRGVWQAEEMAIAYAIFNGYHLENTPGFLYRVDTGCPSCRSGVVTGCRKIAAKHLK